MTPGDRPPSAVPERPRPWAIFQPLKETLYAFTLEHARNRANKAYPVGPVEVEHKQTGEQWKRKAGEWRQTRMAAQPELSLAGKPGETA